MPAVSYAKVAGAWSAIALLLVATNGCTYVVAWSNARAAAAASEVRDVKANAAAVVAAAREEADINVAVITDAVRQAAAAESTFREIRKEVPRAAAAPRSVAAVPPDCPACVCGFSADARRLWNDALAATVPSTTGRADAPAGRPGTAAAEPDAGTDLEEVLRNHVDNAEIHAHNRRQCEGLLAWHRKHQERAP
jgi:hypothetical protein